MPDDKRFPPLTVDAVHQVIGTLVLCMTRQDERDFTDDQKRDVYSQERLLWFSVHTELADLNTKIMKLREQAAHNELRIY